MILFLDMDEVICTTHAHVQAGAAARDIVPSPEWPFRCILDRAGVELLNRACEEAGDVTTVSSSTWRRQITREQLDAHLRAFGWRGRLHEDWATPHLNTSTRGEEIQAWLDRHPEEVKYAILDDNPTAGHGHPVERFCWIQHPYDGLTQGYYWILMRALRA